MVFSSRLFHLSCVLRDLLCIRTSRTRLISGLVLVFCLCLFFSMMPTTIYDEFLGVSFGKWEQVSWSGRGSEWDTQATSLLFGLSRESHRRSRLRVLPARRFLTQMRHSD